MAIIGNHTAEMRLCITKTAVRSPVETAVEMANPYTQGGANGHVRQQAIEAHLHAREHRDLWRWPNQK